MIGGKWLSDLRSRLTQDNFTEADSYRLQLESDLGGIVGSRELYAFEQKVVDHLLELNSHLQTMDFSPTKKQVRFWNVFQTLAKDPKWEESMQEWAKADTTVLGKPGLPSRHAETNIPTFSKIAKEVETRSLAKIPEALSPKIMESTEVTPQSYTIFSMETEVLLDQRPLDSSQIYEKLQQLADMELLLRMEHLGSLPEMDCFSVNTLYQKFLTRSQESSKEAASQLLVAPTFSASKTTLSSKQKIQVGLTARDLGKAASQM